MKETQSNKSFQEGGDEIWKVRTGCGYQTGCEMWYWLWLDIDWTAVFLDNSCLIIVCHYTFCRVINEHSYVILETKRRDANINLENTTLPVIVDS